MRSALERCVGKTSVKYKNTLEGFPSGQREQTVNLPAPPSMVRIRPLHHILLARETLD